MLGLSFEKSGLSLEKNEFIDSDVAFIICKIVTSEIEKNTTQEHQFYRFGEAAFSSKAFMKNESAIDLLKKIFGDAWKKTRYHNLVRLGGDVLRSNLSSFPKATILGGFLWHAKNTARLPHLLTESDITNIENLTVV